jgi:hypothetical protein
MGRGQDGATTRDDVLRVSPYTLLQLAARCGRARRRMTVPRVESPPHPSRRDAVAAGRSSGHGHHTASNAMINTKAASPASSSHRSRRYARPGPPQSAAATPVPHQVTDITASSASVNIRTALPPQPKSPKTRLPTDCQIERLIPTLGPNHHLRAFLVGRGASVAQQATRMRRSCEGAPRSPLPLFSSVSSDTCIPRAWSGYGPAGRLTAVPALCTPVIRPSHRSTVVVQ